MSQNISRSIDIDQEEDGVRIEITREIDDTNPLDNEETAPFPSVNHNSTLNRTSQTDISKQRDKSPKPSSSKKTDSSQQQQASTDENVNDIANTNLQPKTPNRLLKIIKSSPTSAMSFLGIETSPNSRLVTKSADATDSPNTTSKNIRNKTLTSWDERTFRVLNSSPIFGGKVKESKIEKYLDQINEENTEVSDPFLYYKLNGSSLNLSKNKQKITVGKIASESFSKVFKVRI
jgi:hypothetical protein